MNRNKAAALGSNASMIWQVDPEMSAAACPGLEPLK